MVLSISVGYGHLVLIIVSRHREEHTPRFYISYVVPKCYDKEENAVNFVFIALVHIYFVF